MKVAKSAAAPKSCTPSDAGAWTYKEHGRKINRTLGVSEEKFERLWGRLLRDERGEGYCAFAIPATERRPESSAWFADLYVRVHRGHESTESVRPMPTTKIGNRSHACILEAPSNNEMHLTRSAMARLPRPSQVISALGRSQPVNDFAKEA